MAKKLTDVFDVKPSDELYMAEKAVRQFLKSHKGKLNESEHIELRRLLNNRAKELSKVLGVTVHSVCGD